MIHGSLTDIDGDEFYRVDGVEHMDPFLMSVVSSSDLWMFASSRGTLTAGRGDADHALLPYETDDRLHRTVGVTGPLTILARSVDGERELWWPFGADHVPDAHRSVVKATLGDRVVFEERNDRWGIVFRAIWMPSPAYGWVRRIELEDVGGSGADLEVLDGLLDVMPSGVGAPTEQLLSNLVDAYKRSETGRWHSAALYTLEALVSDKTEPAESLAATVIWSYGNLDGEIHLDERVVAAMWDGTHRPTSELLTGRRGAYLRRGPLTVPPGETRAWTLVADVGLHHGAAVDRTLLAGRSDAAQLVDGDVAAGSDRLRRLMLGADGFQRTGDDVADAHHLSNAMYNAMRGGLFLQGHSVPLGSFLEHLRTWNAAVHRRHADAISELGDAVDLQTISLLASESGDPDFVRLVLEYVPIGFSRRHGDPSRPWNRFSIRVRGDSGEELFGYEGNWRDIFQNWEATMLSHPPFVSHAVAKFVNASTIDGHNPYRITDRGIDWEVPDPADPWSNIGYWGDHQIVYLHRLLDLWERVEPGAIDAWLNEPMFVYADVPYVIADRPAMARDPRNTIEYDGERAERIEERAESLGSDGRLLFGADGEVVRVGLLEKLVVPALAKLTSFVPGAGIWMNTQRPEWNDANNALAGYGVSCVTLFHLFGYISYLENLIKLRLDGATIGFSSSVARWLTDLTDALEKSSDSDCETDERTRRALMDDLGAIGDRHRRATREAEDLDRVAVAVGDLERFCRAAMDHLTCSIGVARQDDGLYSSYNLVSFPTADEAHVDRLGPMLEGQVAVLSSGALDTAQSLAVIESLYASAMYRPDQDSFMLYPVRELPSFIERNTIGAEELAAHPGMEELVGPAGPLEADGKGDLHFVPEMINAAALKDALRKLHVEEETLEALLSLYEDTFDHHAYTGRSGSMHGYEGIGSVYWHMVGKLLVAVQESYWKAVDRGEPPDAIDALAGAYRRVRSGLGFRKTPEEFGAIPTDCYSHTPAHGGAQQPGMTGQVKEQILTRFGELGLRVRDGRIALAPGLLDRSEMLAPDGAAEFQYCGIPLTVTEGDAEGFQLHRNGSWTDLEVGLELPPDVSQSIFRRSGEIEAVTFTVARPTPP